MTANVHLEEAKTLLAKSDVVGAFDALLLAWRSLRAKEIAELCEQLSTRARAAKNEQGMKPFTGTHAQRLVAWMNAFHDHSPLGLGRLLADFDALVSSGTPGKGGLQPRFLFPRADALSTLRDDPRLAPRMLHALAVVTGGSKWQKIVLRYFRSIEAAGDPRAIDELTSMLAQNGRGLAPHDGGLRTFSLERGAATLSKLRERFSDEPSPIPILPTSLEPIVRAIKDQIDKLEDSSIVFDPHLTKTTGEADSLLRAVYDAPDDDEVRMVLADALTSRGDPRGELIVLQIRRLSGESTAKTIAREKRLIKEHGKALLGPLASVVVMNTAVFERGFLERCEVEVKNKAMAGVDFQHPEWATVRTIRFRGGANATHITPAMRGLREAAPITDNALQALGAMGGHPKLACLEIQEAYFIKGGAPSTAGGRALLTMDLPSLRHLFLNVGSGEYTNRRNDLTPEDFAWIWTTSWGPRLLTLRVPWARPEQWAESLMSTSPRKQSELVVELNMRSSTSATLTLKRTKDEQGIAVELGYPEPQNASVLTYNTMRQLLDALASLGTSRLIRELHMHVAGTPIFLPEQRSEIYEILKALPNLQETLFPWGPDP